MLRNCALVCCSVLTAMAPVLGASGDPNVVIDSGDPNPLSLVHDLANVQPDGTSPLTFDFLNDSGGIVIDFRFQTTINTRLSPGDAGSFTCTTGYFLNCTISYSSSTGILIYHAYGVNPPDGDEVYPEDTEQGEHEGIPIGAPFHITLTGWVSDATASNGDELYSGLPTFTNSFVAAPEPTGLMLLGTALLLAAGVRRFRSRSVL
jgi:hypothetical protein